MAIKQIAKTYVGHRKVSTIFSDKIEFDSGRNYETVVFGGSRRNKVAHLTRYVTKEEALLGHERIVQDVENNPNKYRLDRGE